MVYIINSTWISHYINNNFYHSLVKTNALRLQIELKKHEWH